MRINVTRSLAGVALGLLMAPACGPPAPDDSNYLTVLVEDRAYKDEFLKTSPDSRVPLDRRSWMLPLRYYEPDLAYRVPAQLAISDDQPVVEIPSTAGYLRNFQVVGHLEFVLNGESRRLAALVELPAADFSRLFVPFRDQTSGTDTYPAGRYLDIDVSSTGVYDLDFNRAYHPDCYFDEAYDCPYPPPQNRLTTKVLAGEKLPPEDDRRIPLTSLVPPPEDPATNNSQL